MSAVAGTLTDPAIATIGDVDTACVTLQCASGRIGVITNSRRATLGYDQRVEVHGSTGTLRTENQPRSTFVQEGAAVPSGRRRSSSSPIATPSRTSPSGRASSSCSTVGTRRTPDPTTATAPSCSPRPPTGRSAKAAASRWPRSSGRSGDALTAAVAATAAADQLVERGGREGRQARLALDAEGEAHDPAIVGIRDVARRARPVRPGRRARRRCGGAAADAGNLADRRITVMAADRRAAAGAVPASARPRWPASRYHRRNRRSASRNREQLGVVRRRSASCHLTYRVTILDGHADSRPSRRIPHLRWPLLAAVHRASAPAARPGCSIHLIGLFTNLFLFHRWGWALPPFDELDRRRGGRRRRRRRSARVACWPDGPRSSAVTASPRRWRPYSSEQSRIAPRTAVAKPLSAAIAIGTGGPFGAEGPIIVTGGALGSLLGQALHVSAERAQDPARRAARRRGWRRPSAPRWRPWCSPSSCCCSSSRPAPSSRSSSRRASPPRVHAARSARGRSSTCRRTTSPACRSCPWFALVGVGCGLLATVIAEGCSPSKRATGGCPCREHWHPVIGAVVWASLGVVRAPGARRRLRRHRRRPRRTARRRHAGRAGRRQARDLVARARHRAPPAARWHRSCSSARALGGLVGAADPRSSTPACRPGAFALVAMAATFGAATRAPFAAIVFVFELTRDYNAILPLMVRHGARRDRSPARCCQHSLMTEKLARRGITRAQRVPARRVRPRHASAT